MTDPRRRVARVPEASTTALGAGALFLGVLGTVGLQMARGHDPALGAARPAVTAAAAGSARPRVVEHRIVRRVIVTRVLTDAAPAAAPPAPAAPVVRATAPVVRTAAPTPVAAPAPAPVQTATS